MTILKPYPALAKLRSGVSQEFFWINAAKRLAVARNAIDYLSQFDPATRETSLEQGSFPKHSFDYQEVERISHDRLAGWLRRHGETEMADLYASDRDAFDRRREAGRSQVHDTPEMKAMRKARTDAPKAGRDEESARGTPGLLK